MTTMNRRHLLKIGGLAGTTVLAGCSSDTNGSNSGSTDTATDTPTPVSIEEVAYPPGWNAEGLQDVDAAAQAHKDALDGVSFSRKEVIDTNQMYDARSTIDAKVDSKSGRALINIETRYRSDNRSGTAQKDIYIDGETLYKRSKDEDSQTYEYSTSDTDFSRRYHDDGDIYGTLSLFALTAQETVLVWGTTGIQFAVTGINSEVRSDSRFRNESYGGVQEGVVTVTTEGRLTSYDVNFGAKDETDAWLERTVEWSSAEDISISEPGWISNVDESSSS